MSLQTGRREFSVTNVTFSIALSAQIKYFAPRQGGAARDSPGAARPYSLARSLRRNLTMVKHQTSPALGLTPTLPLSQLPHVNSASATVPAKRKPSCLTCSAARDAHSSPGDLTTLGRCTQPSPLKPVQRSVFEGMRVNFVSAAAGGLAFAFAEPELGGALPVLFRHVNAGSPRRGHGLGRGLIFRLRRPHRRRRRRLGRAPDGFSPRLPPRRSTSRPHAAHRRAPKRASRSV